MIRLTPILGILFFYQMHKIICPSKQKTIKNHENVLAKDLKDRCIAMNIKQKVRTKIQQTSIVILIELCRS